MPLNFNKATSKPTMASTLDALKTNINYNLNCIKAATVIDFNPQDLTVSCRINNKRLMGLKNDGNQQLRDYPVIYAKVHLFGWGDIGATYPIEPGMEGFLLFNDRELETWFTTGENGNIAYDRCHDLSDAIFICGIHSLPNMIQIAEACLHLFYKNSDIVIEDTAITTNTTDNTLNTVNDTINSTNYTLNSSNNSIIGDTDINGLVTVQKKLTSNGLADVTAASGSFVSQDNKVITVVNGIVTSIS